MVHRNAPLTETGGCAWPGASLMTGGRCGAPRSGTRSRTRPRPAGRAGTGRRAQPGWRTGPPATRQPGPTPGRTERRIVGLRVTGGWARRGSRPAGHEPLHRARRPGPLAAARRWRTWTVATGVPVRRYERAGPASWSTSTSRSSGTSPTAAAIAPRAGPGRQRNRPGPPRPGRAQTTAARPGLRLPAHRPGRPLPAGLHRDPGRRDARKPPRRSWPARTPGTPPPASPSSASSATTAAATGPGPGPAPAPNSASPTSAPGPTGPRPTARSSATTAPWPTNGPTPAPTPPKPSAAPPLTPGCTSTTITGDTPHSKAAPRQPRPQPVRAEQLGLVDYDL